MIPGLVDIGSSWSVLPPGVHDATLQDAEHRFATNAWRRTLFEGFRRGLQELFRAGCRTVFLDGSFVTDKPNPADFDCCWDPVGVDDTRLDPVLLDFSQGRIAQKLKYGGEFFPSRADAEGSLTFLDFFQTDPYTGKAKGILRILRPRTSGGVKGP